MTLSSRHKTPNKRLRPSPSPLEKEDVHVDLNLDPSLPAAVPAIVTCHEDEGGDGGAVPTNSNHNNHPRPRGAEATKFAACLPPLRGAVNWLVVLAWLSHHAALGLDAVFVYMAGVSPPPPRLAKRMAALGLDLRFIDVSRVAGAGCTWYHGQVLFINDCWLRLRAAPSVRWGLFMDWDEFLHIDSSPLFLDFREHHNASQPMLGLRDVAIAAEAQGYGVVTFGSKFVNAETLCAAAEQVFPHLNFYDCPPSTRCSPATLTSSLTQLGLPLPRAPNGGEEPTSAAGVDAWLEYFAALLRHRAVARVAPKCCRHKGTKCGVGLRAKEKDKCARRPPKGRSCGKRTLCVGVAGHRKYMVRPEAIFSAFYVDQPLGVHDAPAVTRRFYHPEHRGNAYVMHTYADATWLNHFSGLVVAPTANASFSCAAGGERISH
mmetsp:Transcript_14829/g.44684  ORF Transcript_14829/g.44684 Transcript_14829/m.44684 type:complete len:432 (-) Transcript_14829:1235-2530(-)